MSINWVLFPVPGIHRVPSGFLICIQAVKPAYLIPGSKSCNPSVLLLTTPWIRELLTWKISKFLAQNRVWWISLQRWWRHNSSWSSVNFSADILNGLDTSLRNAESLPAFKRGLPVSKVIFDSFKTGLRSKHFRGAKFSAFCPREKWGESKTRKEGIGGGGGAPFIAL